MEHTLCLPDNNIINHENNYYDIHSYQKPFTYNDKSDYIKSYNVTLSTINNIKSLYPLSNASPYNSNIASNVNCYMLKINITQTIIDYKLFTSAKKLTSYCNNIASRVNGFTCYHLFLIPEMNTTFTQQQVKRYIT